MLPSAGWLLGRALYLELELQGRCWEWCANRYHPYPAYQAPGDPALEPFPIDREGGTQRLPQGVMPNSSISNVRVSLGPMSAPAPRSP